MEEYRLLPQHFFNKVPIHQHIWFISFGTQNYDAAKYRLFSQAQNIPTFTDIAIYNETSLKQHELFWQTHSNFIESSPRGYGYWLWKPFVILETLKQCNENDIVIYADAGCVLNPEGEARLQEYIHMVASHRSGILAFQLLNNFTESQFTKSDTIKELCADEFLYTRQIAATVIIIRKCEESLNLIHNWYDYASQYNLIDDTKHIPSHSDFRDHRHDQSIFSLLCKKMDVAVLQDETDGMNPTSPIWAIRQRNS